MKWIIIKNYDSAVADLIHNIEYSRNVFSGKGLDLGDLPSSSFMD